MTELLTALTDWLSGLGMATLVGVTVLAWAASIGCGLAAHLFFRRAWMLTYTPRSFIRSAAQGYVVLQGVGRPLPGYAIKGPFSGKPCVWWSTFIEPADGGNDHPEQYAVNPQLFYKRFSPDLFLLQDGTGECLIDPVFAVVDASTEDVWYGNRFDVESIRDASRTRRLTDNLRYTECRIGLHENIIASGEFRSFDGSAEAEQVEGATRALLSEWKHDQAALRARFDKNGDGVIDQQEWDVAREEAHREALAALTRPTSPILHTLRPPADGRDLLLSTRPRAAFGRRLRLDAWVMLFLCAIAVIIGVDAVAVSIGGH